MAKENKKSKEGFTIIEVVLVLAIAGLIFLMVFVALPALRRSQRDTQRRQDYADFSAAIASYMTNNNGKLPSAGATLTPETYVNSTGEDPEGREYSIIVRDISEMGTDTVTVPGEGEIYLYTNADCSGEGDSGAIPSEVTRSKSYAVYGYLETGSYCQSSN